MRCDHLGSRNPLSQHLHRLKCRECRANAFADQVISRGIERLNAEPISTRGMEAALALFGGDAVTPRKRANRKSMLRGRSLSGSALVAIATVGGAGWLAYIDHDPEITIDSPVAPSPNAYNILKDAVRKIPAYELSKGKNVTPNYERSRLRYAIKSTAEKARSLQKEALQAKHASNHVAGGFTSVTYVGEDHFYSVAEKENVLREYANSLALVRHSFAYPYLAPPIRTYNPPMDDEFGYRQLLDAMKLESEVALSHGAYEKAVNCDLDIMEFGALLTQGNGIQKAEWAIYTEGIGRLNLWKLIDRLTLTQTKSAIDRMERIIKKNSSVIDTLTEEKNITLSVQLEQFKSSNWRSYITSTPYVSWQTNEAPNEFNEIRKFLLIHKYSKMHVIIENNRALDSCLSYSRMPYAHQPKNLSSRSGIELRELMTSPMSQLQDPVAYRFNQTEKVETQNALLLTTLALHAYRLEHRGYPKQLSELVPNYLPAVPVDPFSDGKPLKYLYFDSKPISQNLRGGIHFASSNRKPLFGDGKANWFLRLYSIGPDGVDAGGKPIEKKVEGRDAKWVSAHPDEMSQLQGGVEQDSVGDIVAGINR